MEGWARPAMGTASPTKQVRSSGVGFIGFSSLFFQAASACILLFGPLLRAADTHGFKRHFMR